jgi:molecular chaperone Hsp33
MSEDLVLRAITNDAAFRIITLRTTEIVRGVLTAQNPPDLVTARLLGELITGAVLVRETMAPEQRVQLHLRAQDQSMLLADAHPDGMTRGLFRLADPERPFSLGDHTHLQASRILPGNRLHQGIVETNADHGVSGALTSYMLISEQIHSWVEVRCLLNEAGQVLVAGGFIVQILPEYTDEGLRAMTQHLEAQPDLSVMLTELEGDPHALMALLMRNVPHTILQSTPVHYGCNCSQVRLLGALSTLGRDDIEHLLETGEVVESMCDYCHSVYRVGAEQLRGLLARA